MVQFFFFFSFQTVILVLIHKGFCKKLLRPLEEMRKLRAGPTPLTIYLMITAWRWSRDPVHLTWSRSIPEEQSNHGDGSWQWDSLEDLIAKWVSWFQVAARG